LLSGKYDIKTATSDIAWLVNEWYATTTLQLPRQCDTISGQNLYQLQLVKNFRWTVDHGKSISYSHHPNKSTSYGFSIWSWEDLVDL